MMNAHHPLTQMPITSPARTLNTSDRPLHGPWLVVARSGWGAITLINLLIFVFGIPAYTAQLHIICTTDCHPERVTPGNAVALTHLGISLDVYVAYNLAITLIASLVFLIVGAIIFWRKSQVLIGLLVSLLLITFGCCGSTLELVSALSAAHPDWITVQLISQSAYIIYPAIGLFFCRKLAAHTLCSFIPATSSCTLLSKCLFQHSISLTQSTDWQMQP
jgi:hypothetical protein